jgi:hypothetical protein
MAGIVEPPLGELRIDRISLDFSRSSVFASVANVKGALLQG